MDAELSVLQKETFFDLLYKNPRISVELMATLVDRLRKADETIESLAFLEVGERLTKTLLDQAMALDPGTAAGYLRAGKITHKELAARIGSSRETVFKCFKVLAAKAIVKNTDENILVARSALERLKNDERI